MKSKKTIHCYICGKEIPSGKYKLHRIEFHGASEIIMQKQRSKKKKHPQSSFKGFNRVTSAKPFQGGAPGLGKKN